MKHWFKDQHFRSLLKNSSYLAISRVVAAVATLAAISLSAHALGVLLLGALILITSYAKAVSGLAKFQSWQLIVRYGGRALYGQTDDFKTSTGFAFALDAVPAGPAVPRAQAEHLPTAPRNGRRDAARRARRADDRELVHRFEQVRACGG
jgi:hypothetical protein